MRLFINFWNLFLILINFSVYSQIGEDEFLKIENKIIKWRHHIHENPELSNREYETAEYISKHLQKLGIEVKNRVAHTGVVGLLKGTMPGKVLAIRADMDALPVTERNELKYKSIKTSVFNNQKTWRNWPRKLPKNPQEHCPLTSNKDLIRKPGGIGPRSCPESPRALPMDF